jgi:VanZ family protein
MHSSQPRHSLTFSIWLGYVSFVVYGSLVPLDFKPLALDQAWAIFQHVPMYTLGVESRADWIANGVLYVPVGFLTAYLLIQNGSGTRPIPLFFLAGLFSIALAFGVEFTQVFFPPRTVSLNDLLAESVGSLIGIMLAARYSEWFRFLLNAVFSDPKRLTLRLLEAYLAGYIAFSLFPYDILLSAAELEQKLQGDSWGWFLAGDVHESILIAFRSISEIILTLPFGLFLAYRSGRQSINYPQAIFFGVLLGSGIEIAQFFTASGIAQGLSVLTRVAGVCGGLALWNLRTDWSPERLAMLTRRHAPLLGVIYLLVLLQVNGWFSHHWNGTDFAVAQLGELHFLPFYYHYFTTEAKALFSLASVCLMYLPFGLLTWANLGSPSQAFFSALFAAGLVEIGKLFLQNMHPDPTNIMLGALASWGMLHLAREFSKAAAVSATGNITTSQVPQIERTESHDSRVAITVTPTRRGAVYAVLSALLAFVAYRAATFPTQPVLLCLFLAACAAIIWCRPALLFVIVLTALPVLDLAPWSGRFYFDEFDLLLMTGLAIGYARTPPSPRKRGHTDTIFAWVGSLLAISYAISAVRGLTPWQTPDANAFTNYYSPFNALRIVKGALWALLSYGLLRRLVAAGMDTKRPLAQGMVAGLALTVAVTLWERTTFGSLFDFTSDYRVTGPFSSMHTGGAYIECYLAIATPFLVLLILQTQSWLSRLLGVLLLLAATYALMVTFSRNGYAAFGVALSIVLLIAAFKSGRRQQRGILVATLSGAMLAVAIPIFTGPFAQDRMASASQDYAVRQAHWADALNIRTPDWFTTLFGMGLGRYPESHYLLSSEGKHAGTYQLKKEDENTFLRLGSGDPIYFEQAVAIEPHKNYVLKLNVRANKPGAEVATSLCEKWMLTSFSCIQTTLNTSNVTGSWNSLQASFSSGSLGDGPWYGRKTIKLALHNPRDNGQIDIDNVRLETVQGENLLINGDFSNELDHWFFSADSHLQWHAKSLPVAVLFDQGWLGLIALCAFSALAVGRAAGRAWRGDLNTAAALASFSAFLVVGLFDTLIDAPRFLFLFLLLGGFCGCGSFTEPAERQNA